jgi:chromosome segregation ATPase
MQDVLPTVVRAINAARAAESDKRVADIEHALTACKRELEAAVARTQVLESQCNDLRNDRKTNAVERARAEQEVKFLREERGSMDARIKEVSMQVAYVQYVD